MEKAQDKAHHQGTMQTVKQPVLNLRVNEAEDWTFADADIHYMTHGLHPYPARMIPQVARRLIEEYATGSEDVILDPFCGSGGVLIESRLRGKSSIGVDINPLAWLLAKAKSKPIEPKILEKYAHNLLRNVGYSLEKGEGMPLPEIPNMDYWFKEDVIRDLAIIRHHLFQIEDEDIRIFFSACFSKTIRDVSNTRGNEFKLYRIPEHKLRDYNPKVFETFKVQVKEGVARMGEFYRSCNRKVFSHVLLGDTKRLSSLNPLILGEESVNLVVTSPPYGDSRTTVAYGQFSRYPALWLGLDRDVVMKVDALCLGGKNESPIPSLKSETFNKIFAQIQEKDKKRANEVAAFFADMDKCLQEIYLVLKKGKSYCCFVLGNRRVKRIQIPTDVILVELAGEIGFQHVVTRHRFIANKRLPWENAPENIRGEKGKTMNEENIIIWRC